ncbi:MAG TPA: M14 family zinc carboxypeptidase [Actinomycetota bacterium]
MSRRTVPILLAAALLGAALVALPTPPAAHAAVTCNTAATYAQCGRVFPDPLAGASSDPLAEGLLPAADFIQFGDPSLPGGSEIWNGLSFLQSRYDRFLEVWQLHELLDEPDAVSSGLWLAGQRERLPLIMARVTDETVPATEKVRFVFGLSLHGIERAGVEGGTRALEDMVTYAYCETLGGLEAARADAICAKQTHVKMGEFEAGRGGFPARLLHWDSDSLTVGEVLKRTELYFTYNNPDGWHRGDRAGANHYQRYTGNGVDPNRDWPTMGYSYAPYSPGSEPETKYFAEALQARGDNWGSGIDLHGMGGAPVLTYTMLPAGQNDYRKNTRIRTIAQQTQRDALERLSWSELIVPYGAPRRTVNLPVLGQVGQMYPQQWGTVWDTIDYTTTGSYGDWMNSPIGLNSIGMDNEMALSHISNCGVGSCFIPELEQLHVAGNKGLVYADIDTTLRTQTTNVRFPFRARGAYVRYDNVKQNPGHSVGFAAANKLPTQDAITGPLACHTGCVSEDVVLDGPAQGVLNGGVTVNVSFAATHTTNDFTGATFELQRFATDPHDADPDDGEWVTVARHYNQGNPYLTNSMTVTANMPPPGVYRILLDNLTTPGPYTFEVLFDDDLAEADPGQMPYRATQFDFFDELNQFLPEENRFDALTAQRIIEQPGRLSSYDVVVLSDDPLDGWDEEKPSRSTLSKRDHDAYYAALSAYTRSGGTLVLLDGAMQAVPTLTGDPDLEVRRIHEYAGWMGFNNANGPTYDDPLAKDVNVAGAAEGSGNRHQTYEPIPIGYSIDNPEPTQSGAAPVWGISDAAWDNAGGRTVARVESQFTVLGELAFGKGAIRVAGALLPSPTERYDHPFGLASYALTWTGWQVFENLVDVEAQARPAPPKVLANRQLPATGAAPGWLVIGLLLLPALLVARRLRDAFWL